MEQNGLALKAKCQGKRIKFDAFKILLLTRPHFGIIIFKSAKLSSNVF